MTLQTKIRSCLQQLRQDRRRIASVGFLQRPVAARLTHLVEAVEKVPEGL